MGTQDGTLGLPEHMVRPLADRRGIKEELKQFLLRKLPGWQVPREWWFVESLGRNGHEKPSRAQWRKNFLENRARQNVAA
jgi:acyl-CoA synthetase (AMP-forming)/AMP-acid ligase II